MTYGFDVIRKVNRSHQARCNARKRWPHKYPQTNGDGILRKASEMTGHNPGSVRALANAPWETAKQTAEQKKLYGDQKAEQR